MKKVVLLIVISFVLMSMDKNPEAYKLYSANGYETNFRKLLNSALEADIILFGELHNNPVDHWLQLELSRAIYNKAGKKLIMGAEMFEADNSLIISEYLKGRIKDKNFEAEARLWPNYKTDYKPLLTFARDSSIRFVATNIPRRYAALVNKESFDGLLSLDQEARNYIAPLPIEYDPDLSGYKSMLSMMEGSAHANDNLPKAQAIKDATMAHFILKNFKEGDKFIHFHGTYHSDDFQGILWYLKRQKPELKVITISAVEQDDLDELEKDYLNKADFILVTPASMTKTH